MKISVIIPAYNAEDTIGECLQALIEQSLKRNNYEVIVIDDGSTDQTREIVSQYDVKVVTQENSGPAIARNRGVEEAKGEVVVFTDADCVADHHFLEYITEVFKTNDDIAGVQGSYKTKQESIVARFAQIEIEYRYEIMKKKEYIDFVGTYAGAYKKDVFLKMGGFDVSYPMASGEDTDFSFKLAKQGYKIIFESRSFVYHLHPTSVKRYLKQKYWRAYWRNLIYKSHIKKAVKDSYTPQALKLQIVLVGLLLLSVLALFLIDTSYPLLVVLILFSMSIVPFVVFALKRDLGAGLILPMMVFLRSVVFLLGLSWGFIKEICLKQLCRHR